MFDINNMLDELASARESQSKQINDLNYIVEKSNAVLLELDNNFITNSAATSLPVLYSYSTDTFQKIAKIIQKFYEFQIHTNLEREMPHNGTTFEEYLLENVQNLKFLGNNVRKLLAINDIVTQIKLSLLEDNCVSDDSLSPETPTSD